MHLNGGDRPLARCLIQPWGAGQGFPSSDRSSDAIQGKRCAALKIGAQILAGSSSELVKLSEEVAVKHHERWDGTGYPRGLSGEAIPISGRIAAVADVYDALTSLRSYKAAWSSDSALEYMRSEAGKLFDPLCISALINFLDDV